MRVTLPADSASAIQEVGALASLLDKNGWKAAAFIAAAIKPGEGNGRKARTSARLSIKSFAKSLNAKGWSENIINRHYQAWEAAADAGLVPHADDLVYGERIDVPDDGWNEWYPPRWAGNDDAERVAEQAARDGVGKSKAVDISQNPGAMAAAIKADPKLAEVAAAALVDVGNVDALSRATAAAAQNRRVERNRERATEGMDRGRGVEEASRGRGGRPAGPLGMDAGTAASISVHGLADALRALAGTFPREWAALSDEARRDEDFVDLCVETFDKIEMALTQGRMLVSGGVSDDDLRKLLEANS